MGETTPEAAKNQHEVTDDGELMKSWAISEPGFLGTIKQLVCCARCGKDLPAKPHWEPRRTSSDPVFHTICDECHSQLPD